MTGACPSADLLEQMLAEALPRDHADEVEAHVAACPDCQRLLEQLTEYADVNRATIPALSGSVAPEFLKRLVDDPPATTAGGPDSGLRLHQTLDAAARGPAAWPDVPGYAILDELGRGGMGVVYRAREIRLNRVVALKMLLAGNMASRGQVTRFQAEAETVARLQHPNVVRIHAVGEWEGQPFFEMEYIPGGSLASRLDGVPQHPNEAARLVAALAEGVEAVHRLGVIHRDLKPGNILMGDDGTPKLSDFGLAKDLASGSGLTRTDLLVGSPCYMAPEQIGGQKSTVGPTADVYALGVIFYEMLTGRPPFRAATVPETFDLIRHVEPVPPSRLQPRLPRDAETICLKCLMKDPGRRYPTAHELAEDLQRFRAGKPIVARPVGAVERLWRWCRVHPAPAGLVASVASLLIAIAAVATLAAINGRRAAAIARLTMLNDLRTSEARRQHAEAEKLRLTLTRSLAAEETLRRSVAIQRERLEQDPSSIFLRNVLDQSIVRLTDELRYQGQPARAVDAALERQRIWSGHAGHFRLLARDIAMCLPAETKAPHFRWIADQAVDILAQAIRFGYADGASIAGESVFEPLRQREDFRRITESIKHGARYDAPARKFAAHEHPWVDCVALSPDRRLVVSAGYDQTVRLCSYPDGRALGKLSFPSPVLSVAWRPDSRSFLATCFDGSVQLQEIAPGFDPSVADAKPEFRTLHAFHTPARLARSVAVSPDGRSALTVSNESGIVQLWNLETGAEVQRLTTHSKGVASVAFLPDGRRALTGSSDGVIRLWDLGTGGEVRRFKGHREQVWSIALDRDGRRFLSASDDGFVSLWNVENGQRLKLLVGHWTRVRCATFLPDGTHAISGDQEGRLILWDLETGKESRRLLAPSAFVSISLVPEPRGVSAMTSGTNGLVQIWAFP